jgi:DnaJ domain
MTLDRALQIFALVEDDLLYSDSDQIKQIYRKLAKEKHPDKAGGDTQSFNELKEAYILLSVMVQENSGRQLVALDKDEILNKYQIDTRKLHNSLTSQYRSINKIKNEVGDLIAEFEERKKTLENDLNSSVEDLQNQYKKNLIQKIIPFWPSMSESEFLVKYNDLIADQSKECESLDSELFRRMAEIYGEGLNEISEIIDDTL